MYYKFRIIIQKKNIEGYQANEYLKRDRTVLFISLLYEKYN